MPNLTTEKQLVKPVRDTSPIPGYDLVVFRKAGGGEGQRFHATLTPEQNLGLLQKMMGSSLVAYAVTRDLNLRHKMAIDNLRSADYVGPFSLELSLSLSVSNSRAVVEKLESDPLSRLEQEVRDIISRVARRMEWDVIGGPLPAFEAKLLSAPVSTDSGERVPSLEFLKLFARELGFQLRSIHLSQLSSEELGKHILLAREEKWKQEKAKLQGETEQLELQLDLERQRAEARHRNLLDGFQRISLISQGATENLNRILSQIADKIDSVPALRQVLGELMALRQEIALLPSLGGAEDNRPRELKVIGSSPGVAAITPGCETPLAELLARTFGMLEGLTCESRDKDRLFSCILHQIGEVVLRDEGNQAAVQEGSTRIAEQTRKLARSAQSEQLELLKNLQSPQWILSKVNKE